MAFHVNAVGPDAGDWLAFAGALVGVVLTISGTLWLEDFRSKARDKRGTASFIKAVNDVSRKLQVAARARGQSPIEQFRAEQIRLEKELLRSFEFAQLAQLSVTGEDIDLWYESENFLVAIGEHREELEREIRLLSDAGDNENVLAVNLDKISQIEAAIRPSIIAVTRLPGIKP